jgi:glycine cleavage system regulatory protein
MDAALVMTVIGSDRPGLVESIATTVAQHSGNWLESRMSRLGGQFAGILRVQVPAAQADPLAAALRSLHNRGLTIFVQPDTTTAAPPVAPMSLLELVGHDRPGIVHQISRALAAHGVNVEELHTECSSAAMSGETLFKARARLSIPPTCDASALRRELERIGEDLIVDVTLAPVVVGATPR